VLEAPAELCCALALLLSGPGLLGAGGLLAGLFFLARSPVGFALFSAFEHGSLQLVS
jgi:hypothetical protein